CKEFAKTAFNMDLGEFMNRYSLSRIFSTPVKIDFLPPTSKSYNQIAINEIWLSLQKTESAKRDLAGEWLSQKRGIETPRHVLKCGFSNLFASDISLFSKDHQGFVAHRAMLGAQIVVPLRGHQSDEVKN